MGREEENEKRLKDKEKGRNREETGRQSYVRHQEGTGRTDIRGYVVVYYESMKRKLI